MTRPAHTFPEAIPTEDGRLGSADRAATASQRSPQAVSGIAGITDAGRTLGGVDNLFADCCFGTDRQHAAPECSAHETSELKRAAELAYGLLWHMRIDLRDDNLKLASDARKALLAAVGKDGQFRGIDAAKMTDARFTGAA